MNNSAQDNLSKPLFTAYEKIVIAMLAFLQFTIVLDFMIMSPLGAVIMPALKMNTSQFGMVVSAYAFSAGVSGFLAAGWADKFDRKKILLFFYSGFLVGTFLCALAPTFEFLFAARMITGIFGGVIGSIVLSIATDLFSFERRGQVMGYVQTAFAASQILGIPLGLWLSAHWGWHMPFLLIVGVGLLAGLFIFFKLQPLTMHLKVRHDRNPFEHLFKTLTNTYYLRAFATTALLSLGGFMLMPFTSAFTVNNVGISLQKLPMIYFITGITAIFTGPLVGKAADKYGKFKVFLWGAVFTIICVIIYTNLGVTPLPFVILINVILFASIFSRMIPSQALISAIPEAPNRGSFMAVNSSLQQMAGGVASVVAGLIVSQASDGKILHFNYLGYLLSFTVFISIGLMYSISRKIES
jgi:predicted MFS family arabinose efflux permease